MPRFSLALSPIVLIAILFYNPIQAQSPDGFRFDSGKAMKTASEGAALELSELEFLFGSWDVELTTYPSDSTSVLNSCVSEISYGNRGHLFLERFHCPESKEASGFDELKLYIYNNATQEVELGIVNRVKENVELLSGELKEDGIHLWHASRPGGTGKLVYRRYSIKKNDLGFAVLLESSFDQKKWRPIYKKEYSQAEKSASDDSALFAEESVDFGTKSADLPVEDFDFLIGEFNASNAMTFPNGQQAQWPSTATAVWVLGGKGIMEFSWFDLDPNLPDAATTIIRIYNRATRQWENLYANNRSTSLLHFNGIKNGEKVILHNNDVDTTVSPIAYYVFHDIDTDSYKWYSEISTDRGKSFSTNRTIDFTRK